MRLSVVHLSYHWDENRQVTEDKIRLKFNVYAMLYVHLLCRMVVLILTCIKNSNRHFEIIIIAQLLSFWVGSGPVHAKIRWLG